MKYLLILLLCIVTLLGISSFYFHQTQSPQSLQQIPPTPTLPAQSVLRLLPENKIVQPGVQATIDVVLQNHNSNPDLIQLEIAYDPLILTNMTIITGNIFDNPAIHFSKINPDTGRISYAISPTRNQKNASDSAIVATLSFTPLLSLQKETELSFLPKTLIKTKDGINILNGAYGAKLMTKDGMFRGQTTENNSQKPERQNTE